MSPECARCGEPIPGPEAGFAVINQRYRVISRIITAAEWLEDGAYEDARDVLHHLERELLEVLDEERLAA